MRLHEEKEEKPRKPDFKFYEIGSINPSGLCYITIAFRSINGPVHRGIIDHRYANPPTADMSIRSIPLIYSLIGWSTLHRMSLLHHPLVSGITNLPTTNFLIVDLSICWSSIFQSLIWKSNLDHWSAFRSDGYDCTSRIAIAMAWGFFPLASADTNCRRWYQQSLIIFLNSWDHTPSFLQPDTSEITNQGF